jgi:hypothetical protein
MSLNKLVIDGDGTYMCDVCVRNGEFAPYIMYTKLCDGDGLDDPTYTGTLGYTITNMYDTKKLKSGNALIESYIASHKFRLESKSPYYRGKKYKKIMDMVLTGKQLLMMESYTVDNYEYAVGLHSNCNTVLYNALAFCDGLSAIQKIALVTNVLEHHGKTINEIASSGIASK